MTIVEAVFASPQAVAADIAREYRGDAAKWTQGWYAKTNEGLEVESDHPKAVCWCLRGAIDKRVKHCSAAYNEVLQAFEEALGYAYDNCSLHFVGWNDTPGRTVGEVIELCDRVVAS